MQEVVILTREEYELLSKPIFTEADFMKALEDKMRADRHHTTLWITLHAMLDPKTYAAIGDEYERRKKEYE